MYKRQWYRGLPIVYKTVVHRDTHHLQKTVVEKATHHVQKTGSEGYPSCTKDNGSQGYPSSTKDSGSQGYPSCTKDSGSQGYPSCTKDSGLEGYPSYTKESGSQGYPPFCSVLHSTVKREFKLLFGNGQVMLHGTLLKHGQAVLLLRVQLPSWRISQHQNKHLSERVNLFSLLWCLTSTETIYGLPSIRDRGQERIWNLWLVHPSTLKEWREYQPLPVLRRWSYASVKQLVYSATWSSTWSAKQSQRRSPENQLLKPQAKDSPTDSESLAPPPSNSQREPSSTSL